MPAKRRIAQFLERDREPLLEQWLQALRSSEHFSEELMGSQELRERCESLYDQILTGLSEAQTLSVQASVWKPVRDQLTSLSRAWVQLGLRPSDVAAFIRLLKQPLIERLVAEHQEPSQVLLEEIRTVNELLDNLTLWTMEAFQHGQQKVIERQQTELLELSTPVVSLWQGIVALPLIGTLDSARTQVVMESLLERIVEYEADVAILDITGVPTVDTMVAQHLIKAVTAARLMGTDCIISGIRPSIAQTMVQLGIDLGGITTKATLAAAFEVALRTRGLRVAAMHGDGRTSRPERRHEER